MTTIITNTEQSMLLDPEEEAFKALRDTICAICRKQGIAEKGDPRMTKLVDKYKERYPSLTPESVEEELRRARYSPSPIDCLEIHELESRATSALTLGTAPWMCYGDGGDKSHEGGPGGNVVLHEPLAEGEIETDRGGSGGGSSMVGIGPKEEGGTVGDGGCCSSFENSCGENGGYNLLTYSFLQTAFLLLMFATSVVSTYLGYSLNPYRDWALAGGVTSTTASFRVRGPANDDGKRREFVVSPNPNLAIERDQILNVPVSFGDFAQEEHGVKRIEIRGLEPATPYYYGITKPQRTQNSAVVSGSVGTFSTPAPEGERMDFTVAMGSCALTGSKSEMFERVLDLDPLMFIHMGDFHYEDTDTIDVDQRLVAYDMVMGSPSQRLLYTHAIFSYIWDDHDWIGNNQDGEDDEAGGAAKQGYTLGIPHYELGSGSKDEANAAKYQAFTIGTIRFIITDLRSESIKSSEYYPGRVYSKEQKEWLFNELSQAENYDFVVWVTTRPWTDEVKPGSDGWGGFASDRAELSAHIASTVGAGPRNLFVISGDNHMVAFDDGSGTDFSRQDSEPGGFPLLHSGPLANYGHGVTEFFAPEESRFTEGCMAYGNEVNHQFSTVDFYFPRQEDAPGCIRIRSYSEDSSNVIFEREMCGEIMRYGAPEQEACKLKKLSVPTASLFIAAAGLVVLNSTFALCFMGCDRCHQALGYFGLGLLYYVLTIGAAVGGAYCFRTKGVNMLVVATVVLSQSVAGSCFVGRAMMGNCPPQVSEGEPVRDERVKLKEEEGGIEEGMSVTQDETLDDTMAHPDAVGAVTTMTVAMSEDCRSRKLPSKTDEAVAQGLFVAREVINASPDTVEAMASRRGSIDGNAKDGCNLRIASPADVLVVNSVQALGEGGPATGEDDENSSVGAVLCGGVAQSGPDAADVASKYPKALFSKKRGRSNPVFVESLTTPRGERSFCGTDDLVAALSSQGVGPFPEVDRGASRTATLKKAEEGIEVTNPTQRIKSACDIKVSPSLLSL